MKIITTYECKPIPVRNFDWVAYEDGKEEDGIYGYGATEVEAIEELKELLEI
jgi:hypothetical protein